MTAMPVWYEADVDGEDLVICPVDARKYRTKYVRSTMDDDDVSPLCYVCQRPIFYYAPKVTVEALEQLRRMTLDFNELDGSWAIQLDHLPYGAARNTMKAILAQFVEDDIAESVLTDSLDYSRDEDFDWIAKASSLRDIAYDWSYPS